MKKLILSTLAIALFVAVSAQTVITYEAHALKSEENNPMSYCEYLEPGQAGENVTWDFSNLEFKKSFTGYLNNSTNTELGKNFANANTELAEFNSRFYFKVDESKIEQYGYSSADGRSQIKYNTPFVKIKYPFAYGEYYSGVYNGNYIYAGNQTGDITGSYSVEADAWGELVLPGNSVYENTLRVRTEKTYTNQFNNSNQEVTVITYRWYNQAHRYPLLVLTEYTTKSASNSNTSYQAAYNNNAVNSIPVVNSANLALYPNPASTELRLDMETSAPGELNFRIFDASGRLVRSFEKSAGFSGAQTFNLSDQLQGLYPGTYSLVIENGDSPIKKSFTLVD